MLNLNRTWIEKQVTFRIPIILLAIIWYLKIYKNGICVRSRMRWNY